MKAAPTSPAIRPARAALAASALGFFVITLDAVIVNVTLPSTRHELGGGMTGLQWIVDGYTLMFAALLLASGALSDRIGARRAFGASLVVFLLASVGCGLAPGLAVLVAARFLQGAAAALMMPASMALIGQAYPEPARRARAIAWWAMGGGLASSVGPVLGGLLSAVSWRLVYFINLPVGIAALWLLARTAPSPRQPAPFDWNGQWTAVLAMGGLTFGAIEAGALGLTAPPVLIAFAIAATALLAFARTQRHGAHPMLPADLFASRNVTIANAIGFAFMVGYYGLPFVTSLYLQQVRGLSPLAAGLVFAPMMVTGAALTPSSARIVERIGARTSIITGLLLMAAGLLLMAVFPVTVPVPALAAAMVLVGLSGPLIAPPVTAVLLDSVPGYRAGIASGVFNTSRQIGGALAVAVFGALLAQPAGFVPGMRLSLLLAAAVALVTVVASFRLRASIGEPGEDASMHARKVASSTTTPRPDPGADPTLCDRHQLQTS